METRYRAKASGLESYEPDDRLKDLGDLSKYVYDTDWQKPSRAKNRFSVRRMSKRKTDRR